MTDLTGYRMIVLDKDGELVDAADDVECIESVLYGDLTDWDGPRTIQIPLTETEFIARVQWLIDINADCFGLIPDRIEEVLC